MCRCSTFQILFSNSILNKRKLLFYSCKHYKLKHNKVIRFFSAEKIDAQKQQRSLAELIMMRESLAGFPRESFSVLFRQSLSGAELERMFEDDSTGNFEKLEMRLKTPKRPMLQKSVSKLTAIQQPVLTDKGEDEESVGTEVQQKEEAKTETQQKEKAGSWPEQEEEQRPEVEEVPESFPVLTEEEISEDVFEAEAVETRPPIQSTPEKTKEAEEENGVESPESYTEEDLANLEIIEYEFEDSNMSIKDLSIFDRSLSLADLREEQKQVITICNCSRI